MNSQTADSGSTGLDSGTSQTKIISSNAEAPYTIRRHKSGDMEVLSQLQREFYSKEFGFTEPMLVGAVDTPLFDFEKNYNPDHDKSWIAEINGRIVGCVLIIRESDEVARLRQLFVDVSARGMGLGTKLVNECISFSKEKGYKEIVL